MCSHILSSRQTFVISGIGSTLAVDVVPTVATTASGLKLLKTSVATISRNVDTFIRNWPSVGTRWTLSSPIPIAIAPFSTELCA